MLIEENKPEAIAAVQKVCANENKIHVHPVHVKYPQGGERAIMDVVAGKHIKLGMLPADVGCVVDNVATVRAIYRAVAKTEPLMERGFTVSGDGVNKPCNLIVKIGTSFEEMLEAAIIDGCSPIGCFFKMVVPMSLNSIITVATMQAVFCWNEYINAYTFTRSTDMKTITLGLNDFVGSMGLTDWGGTFAAITVTVLPVFIFYFFSSKKMLAGMTAGAVKG